MRTAVIVFALLGLSVSTLCAQIDDPFIMQRSPATEKVYLEALPGTLLICSTKKSEDSTENRLRTGFVIDKENRLALTQYSALAGEGFKVVALAPLYIGERLETSSGPYQEMLNKGKGLPASIVAVAPKSDLAILQLEVLPENTKALRLAKVPGKVGGRVLVICAAFSTKEMWTYTPGIIAGVAPRKWHEDGPGLPGAPGFDFDCRVMQTEHFLVQAQMGGPVVNERGEVVAMNQGVGDGGKTANIDLAEIRTLLASKEVTAITGAKAAVAADKPEKPAKPSTPLVEEKTKAKAELAAASKLRLARSLAKANKKEAARQRCEELIKAFPDSAAAAEAKALLEELGP